MVLKSIENQRLLAKIQEKNYLKDVSFISGDFITIWYINREREKGNIRYQYTRGVCLSVKYKKYNSTFIIRSIIKGIGIEQNFCFHSLNNLHIKLKKNIIRNYIKNKLLYLRTKKNKQSKYII